MYISYLFDFTQFTQSYQSSTILARLHPRKFCPIITKTLRSQWGCYDKSSMSWITSWIILSHDISAFGQINCIKGRFQYPNDHLISLNDNCLSKLKMLDNIWQFLSLFQPLAGGRKKMNDIMSTTVLWYTHPHPSILAKDVNKQNHNQRTFFILS